MKSSTWSSDRAATLRQALSSAGPVEIEAALQRSVIESDRDLASAAIQIWESWPKAAKDSVRISKREVAEALVSNEWNRARRSILLTEIANGEAAMEIARAEGRDVPSQTKIQQGLRRKKFAALNAQIESANSEGEAA